MKRITILFAATLLCAGLSAQTDAGRIVRDMDLDLETTTTASGGSYTPLWLSSNRYGLSSTHKTWNYERVALHRYIERDAQRSWRFGWGADLAVMFGGERLFNVTELYAEAAWKKLYLSVGSKKQPLEFRNDDLSLGGMSYGINARPIPQVRGGLDWIGVPWTQNWFRIKGFISYGMYTDGRWQESYTNNPNAHRTSKVLYHEKAIYASWGRLDKFPVVFETGLQFQTQFGGTAYNFGSRGVNVGPEGQSMQGGIKGMWNALTFGGADITDGNDKNFEGNHLFGWLFSLRFEKNGWMARAYWEQFFEDNLVYKYGLKDRFIGVELKAPKNPYLIGFTLERLYTKKQTGPVYHDPSSNNNLDQIGGIKNYNYHLIYNGWQHYGMFAGNPFMTSPLYNGKVKESLIPTTFYNQRPIDIANNRVDVWNIGLQGEPIEGLTWRARLSFSKNWGTYYNPTQKPGIRQDSYMLEVGYRPSFWQGWQGKVAFGLDHGTLIGNNYGAQLTIIKSFTLNKKKS